MCDEESEESSLIFFEKAKHFEWNGWQCRAAFSCFHSTLIEKMCVSA